MRDRPTLRWLNAIAPLEILLQKQGSDRFCGCPLNFWEAIAFS
ncbi:MAG: hypothetical protein VKJ64_08740 [Leptolyngbyaceae bacterium]|nr:hypothetical protein [Leptolyngbyaceae bacterium]